MNIGTLCKRDVVTIDDEASLREAAIRMRERHVGTLVVTTETAQGPRVVGLVTDRDLAVEGMACSLDPQETAVSEVISGQAVALPDTASVSEAVHLMRSEGVRRLLVVAQEQQLLGIIAMDDLLAALAADLTGLSQAVRTGMARETVQRRPVETAPAIPVSVPQESLPLAWR